MATQVGNIRGPVGLTGPPGPAGPTVVSADAGNAAVLGTDSGIFVSPASTIIAGNGPPGAVGNTGDYYLDQANDILYGPKTASAGASRAFNALVPQSSVTSGAQPNVNGNRLVFAVAGQITELWHYRNGSSNTTSKTLKLWRVADQALLATAVTSGETGGGWISAPLATPFNVVAGDNLLVTTDYPAGDTYVYRVSGSFASDDPNVTLAEAFSDPTLGVYPVTSAGMANFFQDVTFIPNAWPVALRSADEVFIGSADPGVGAGYELWYDTSANTMKVLVAGAWNAYAAPTPWTAPVFQSGWTNFGGGYQPARYRKIGDQVYIEGLIAGGTLGQPAFTLPVGFRPPNAHQFAEVSNGLYGYVVVGNAGAVQPGTGSNVNFQINCNFSTI